MERGEHEAPNKMAQRGENIATTGRRHNINTNPVSNDGTVAAICAASDATEAIERLMSEMPTDTGLAFVVLNPRGANETLVRLTDGRPRRRVRLARDGIRLMPNEVYVVPPGVHAAISSGHMHFSPVPASRHIRMPVDFLLDSLAASQGNRSIGVLMSNIGEDGADGLKALKTAGGLTIVRDPKEARRYGRLSDAVLMARPDYVLSAADIPTVLVRCANHPYFAPGQNGPGRRGRSAPEGVELSECVERLRSKTGKDFGSYKPQALLDRIERRLALHGIGTWSEYFTLLHDSSDETRALADDLLIDVTGFFRDSELFDALIEPLTGVLDRHPDKQPFRIWVSGCGTGEAAYSLGMFVQERTAAMDRHLAIQMFATDLDNESVEIGRGGIYPESIQNDVSPQRLEQFFAAQYGSFRITNEFRKAVFLSRHDVARDPPFSRLDLVWCRKFACLASEFQRRALAKFHFALNKHGLLLLDSAEEALSSGPVLFSAVDQRMRIYRRRGDVQPAWLELCPHRRSSPRRGVLLEEELAKVRSQLNGTIREQGETDQRLMLTIGTPRSSGAGTLSVDRELEATRQGAASLNSERVAVSNRASLERDSPGRSRILAAASHDLRQPLQAIRLLHGLLKDRTADQTARKTIITLEESVDHMIDLLDAIRDVDQLEAGTIAPEFSECSIASLLDSAADEFAFIATARGLKLRRVSSSVTIRSDHRLLARVIGNLVSNAIRRTDHGKILLGCRRRGHNLRIEVWDTGIGVPLEGFGGMQAESHLVDRTDLGKGGLNLYIVRRLSQLLGLSMQIRSEPSRGTMFAIVIPVADLAVQAPKRSEAIKETLSEPTGLLPGDYAAQLGVLHATPGHTPTAAWDIAIIDDEPLIREALRATLEAERYSVQTYGSAEAFLSDVEHPHFRCLIVDLTLTGVDGLQLLSRLRLEHLSPPMIFVTGQADLPMAVRAMREGAADFLLKPLRPETLRESIARALLHGDQAVSKRKEREDTAARVASLTVRERQVLDGMLAGQLNKNIAAELGISRRTTEHHRQSVFRKMGTKSLAMLVRMVRLPGDNDGPSLESPGSAGSGSVRSRRTYMDE
jgi:FixJ family two-component response regulator/chemotaxis methyl-accepting protein methylase/anti-sigma regulatory factor (Ser/Thr protein kinase)